MWREHGILRATDSVSMQDPSLLRDAQFMHNLTTGARDDGDLYVEVAYRFYASDHELDAGSAGGAPLDKLSADQGTMMCTCASPESTGTDCTGLLAFGNYEFSIEVAYNREQCANGVNAKVEAEFRHSLQTADQLVALYLRALRRKAHWL